MTSWSDIKISFGYDAHFPVSEVRQGDCRKPAPVEPPAKYESKGTWFERCGLSGHDHRAAECPYVQGHFHRGGCTAQWSITYDQARGRAKRKPMSQVKVTFASWNAYPGSFEVEAYGVKITTPAGATVTAEEAARAVDELAAVWRECSLVAGELASARTGWDRAINMAETRRKECDEARAKLAEARKALSAWSGASPFPPHVTLQGLRDALTAALGKPTFAERLTAGPQREPAPTPTADTPVTLGMLRDLTIEGDEIRRYKKRTYAEPSDRSVLGQAIDKKLGR
jgi:hypothetical protein